MERRRHSLELTAALAAVMALVAPAGAEAQAEAEARAYYQQGVQALEAARYSDAASAFHRSYQIVQRVETLCNLAVTYDRWSGHVAEAIQYYDQCASYDSSGQFSNHARQRAAELRASQPPPQSWNPPPDPFVNNGQPAVSATTYVAPGMVAQPATAGPTAEPPSRDHTLLWVGIGGAVVSIGLAIAGYFFVDAAADDDDYLFSIYGTAGGPPYQIPATLADGSPNPDVGVLEDAETNANIGIGMYIGAAALGALSIILAIVDLAQPSPTAPAYALMPTPDGGLLGGARLTF